MCGVVLLKCNIISARHLQKVDVISLEYNYIYMESHLNMTWSSSELNSYLGQQVPIFSSMREGVGMCVCVTWG